MVSELSLADSRSTGGGSVCHSVPSLESLFVPEGLSEKLPYLLLHCAGNEPGRVDVVELVEQIRHVVDAKTLVVVGDRLGLAKAKIPTNRPLFLASGHLPLRFGKQQRETVWTLGGPLCFDRTMVSA